MQKILLLMLMLFLASCVTSYEKNLSYNSRMLQIQELEKFIDSKTNSKYGHLILRYDLLEINGYDRWPIKSCPSISPLYYSLINDQPVTKVAFSERIKSLRLSVRGKIRDFKSKEKISKNALGVLSHMQNGLLQSSLFTKISTKQSTDPLETLSKINSQVEATPIFMPMSGTKVTSKFGYRKRSGSKKLTRHEGIDLQAYKRAKIYATAPGKVRFADILGNYGKLIIIDHANNYSTYYAHLDEINVNKGDSVFLGQPIGTQGNTGNSSNDHLHYEIRIKAAPQDPIKYTPLARLCPSFG